MASHFQRFITGILAIVVVGGLFLVHPVYAGPTQSTGECIDAAKAQLGKPLSQIDDLSCYSASSDCTSAGLTIMTGTGLCPSPGAVCCAKPKAPALPACTTAGQGMNPQLGTVGCIKNAGACAGAGGIVVPSNGCTAPAVCCKVQSAPVTCNQLAIQFRGKNSEGFCVEDSKCPSGYESITGGKQAIDCGATKVCCFKSGQAGSDLTTEKGASPALIDPVGGATFFQIIQRIIRVFLGMVGALAFAVFIYAGVTWMTADSSNRVKTAKETMKNAVIGIVLIILSYAITNFIIGAVTNSGSVAPKTSVVEPATPQELQP